MEMLVIGLLICWIGVSTVVARLVATRNDRSAAFNATLVTVIGYGAVTAALVAVMLPMVPPMVRDPIASVLPPIAIAGAVAAVLAWILAFVSIGRARKAQA
ncbi:hypothetical protein [Amorphus sp. MBR-141]